MTQNLGQSVKYSQGRLHFSMGRKDMPNAKTGTGKYADVYASSCEDPNAFWLKVADGVDWIKPPKVALDDTTAPVYRWFPDAELNTCFNAIDRHVLAGRGEQTAIIYDSAMTGTKKIHTYNDLLEKVSVFAGALANQGVGKGDRP
jgi:propionyl-CoA synthetase